MFGLIPRPYAVLALVLILVGTNALTAYRFYRTGEAFAEARHAKAMAEARAEAEAKSKQMVQSVTAAAEEAYREQAETDARLAGADRAVDRLREAVASANLRADSATAAASDGATARTLLAECVGQYRDVARDADRLRAIVIGLQGYARAVSQ